MKILLYGGTFDPPHNGHKNNLRAALERVRPDRAIVMPAGTPPHKHASATPAELRLQMCQCFRALSPAVEVSDWEIRQGGRSYTVHTLEMLRGANPGAELYLCVGSDMLLTFGEWYRWQDMLKMAALVVESRTGTDDAALHAAAAKLEQAGGTVLFAQAESYDAMEDALFQALDAADSDGRAPLLAEGIAMLHRAAGASERALALCGMTAQELRAAAHELEAQIT